MWSRAFAFCLLIACAVAKNEIYEGYKSYYVSVLTPEQQRAVNTLSTQHDVDILSPPLLARRGVLLVPPTTRAAFLEALDSRGIQYEVHRENVKAALDQDDDINEKSRTASRQRNEGRSVPYDNYQEWEVIDDYMGEIAALYPDLVTIVTAANSFEGRPIRYLKISTTNFADTTKPVIFIDGGIHSREWISPPTVTWAIHKLVENITEGDLLDQADWILHPVVNPDGYKYTFTDVRMWRKTRSGGATCPGVDGNRNYNFAWNTVGTSPNPCSDTYAGTTAFSEVETRVVRDILLEHLDRIALYITMHSYGSMILYPWGHDSTFSWNAYNLHVVAAEMTRAIDELQHESFPNYIAGNSGIVIGYEAAGAAEDYAHSIGVPLAYTIELPGLAGGFEGFHLPPEYIERVVQETWAGVVAGARTALALYTN